MEDEDVLNAQAVSESIAHVVLKAYKNRFPRMDRRDRVIMINSLLLSVCAYLKCLEPKEKQITIDMIVEILEEIRDESVD